MRRSRYQRRDDVRIVARVPAMEAHFIHPPAITVVARTPLPIDKACQNIAEFIQLQHKNTFRWARRGGGRFSFFILGVLAAEGHPSWRRMCCTKLSWRRKHWRFTRALGSRASPFPPRPCAVLSCVTLRSAAHQPLLR
jgi:hypothetical protein